MTKAGIGEQTIILTIQRGPVKFDTSPQALIDLKGGSCIGPGAQRNLGICEH